MYSGYSGSSKEAILKITYPFREVSVHHIAPVLPLEEELEAMRKMEI